MSNYSCIRHVLCCVNLLFWVLGCGMLGVGIWLYLATERYGSAVLSHRVLSCDSLIISVGVTALILGFFGCCGAWFQSKFLLRAYFTFVILILLLELTAGTLGFIYRKHIGEVLQDELIIGIQNKYTAGNKHGLKEMWDHIHTQFECCGVRSYEDWFEISTWPHKKWVPQSCCLPQYRNITTCGHTLDISKWHHAGCYPRLHSYLMERMYLVGIVCLTFAFIQLFGIITALLIVCSLGKKLK